MLLLLGGGYDFASDDNGCYYYYHYYMYSCTRTWSSGWCCLIMFRLWFEFHGRSFASNLEQVANLLCAQLNLCSYPQRDGQWIVAYGLWGKGLVWLIGAVVCLLAANCWSSCSLMRATDSRIMHCDISSCQSAATFENVKCFWSRVWIMYKKRYSKYWT